MGASTDTSPSSACSGRRDRRDHPVGSGAENEKYGPATGFAPPNTAASLSVQPA